MKARAGDIIETGGSYDHDRKLKFNLYPMENIIKEIVMQIKISYRGYKQSLLSKRIIPRAEWVNTFVKIHTCTWNVHGSQSETETLVDFICIYWVGSRSDVIHLRCWGALVSCFQCFCRQVSLCFSKVHFSLAFYCRNLVFSPWNLIWNSFYTVENPNLV